MKRATSERHHGWVEVAVLCVNYCIEEMGNYHLGIWQWSARANSDFGSICTRRHRHGNCFWFTLSTKHFAESILNSKCLPVESTCKYVDTCFASGQSHNILFFISILITCSIFIDLCPVVFSVQFVNVINFYRFQWSNASSVLRTSSHRSLNRSNSTHSTYKQSDKRHLGNIPKLYYQLALVVYFFS